MHRKSSELILNEVVKRFGMWTQNPAPNSLGTISQVGLIAFN